MLKYNLTLIMCAVFCWTAYFYQSDAIEQRDEAIMLAAYWKERANIVPHIPDTHAKGSEADKKRPIGIANNNPCNIKNVGWYGQVGSDQFGHAIFEHENHGLRACAKVLEGFQSKHGLKTIRAIVGRFAEGNQSDYIKHLSRALKIGPDVEFDAMKRMPELVAAMVKFETGKQPFGKEKYALLGVLADM